MSALTRIEPLMLFMHPDSVPASRSLTANNSADVTRLYKYFSLLRQVAHPGIVEVVEQRFGATNAELRLAVVDGEPFEDTDFATPAALASTVMALAVTVAHLHGHNVVHGRLAGPNVIVTHMGQRPVITSLAKATPLTAANTGAADVLAIGLLLRSKLPVVSDPIRDRINGRTDSDQTVLALQHIAAAATAKDPLQRPTAKELAILLRKIAQPESTAVPAARRRARHRQSALQDLRKHRRALAIAAGAVTALLSSAVVLSSLADTESQMRRTALVNAQPRQVCAIQPPAALVTDVDNDGCADSVEVTGSKVTVNGSTYEVAREGDILTVGRWKASAPRTLALLRPSTGRVFAFDTWPAGDETIAPRAVGSVSGAVSLAVMPRSDGTDDLRVTTSDGRTVDIDPERTADTGSKTNTTRGNK